MPSCHRSEGIVASLIRGSVNAAARPCSSSSSSMGYSETESASDLSYLRHRWSEAFSFVGSFQLYNFTLLSK